MCRHFALTLIAIAGVIVFSGCSSDNNKPAPVPGSPPNVIFITSVTGDGNFSSWADAGGNTGLAAADAVCQTRAVAAGLSGNFVAWVSDDNDDAYCRLHGFTGKKSANCGQGALPVAAGPFARTDGTPFSETIDLALAPRNQIYSPLRFDESGVAKTDITYTNTDSDGVSISASPCGNWTDNSNVPPIVTGGTSEATSVSWTESAGASCDNSLALICMQTGVGAALPAFATSGKQAFVTSSSTGSANLGGLAAADSICQNLAASASLANAANFKAWLSDSGADAIDRFVSDGPWVRLDGIKIADNKADLIDGTLFTSLNLDDQGIYITGDSVWTGTSSVGVADSFHCNGWTSSSNMIFGRTGRANSASSTWTFGTAFTCDSNLPRLYCLED